MPSLAEHVARINALNAFQLASDAECGTPDDSGSEGALFLTRVRDDTVEKIEYASEHSDGDLEDLTHGIADNAPSVYTHTLWKQFVDLTAYQEEPEAGEWPEDLNKAAAVALYQVAERLALVLLNCPDCSEWVTRCECDDEGADDA